MNELQIQRELVRELYNQGGFGFKANNRFLVGVADLHLLHRDLEQPVWLEVKYERSMRRDGSAPLNLTPLQRRFIFHINDHGGVAGWCLVVKDARDHYCCAVGRDSNFEHVASWPLALQKGRGEPWPIRNILQFVCKK